ncbi:MAG: sensor histidine kinase [Clostridia bacterium]|nr:sensor histidine kinase [Clostridia bacterium]
MRDLSMHVLDIAQNSIKAGATLVTITFDKDENNMLRFTVEDNGCGMSEEFLKKVTDPFTTTRTTRKVGLGIPMLKQSAEMSDGAFSIQSTVNVGTTISATFHLGHIDCIPMGEICDTLLTLVTLNPEAPEFVFQARAGESEALFDTRMVREALGGIPLNEPDIYVWMKESIEEEFKPILEVS